LDVGVVFAELALLFLGEGWTVRELVVDGPRLGLFFASSSSSSRVRRSIDWILISVLHVVCGRSARDPLTVHEKIFRADSPRFNHGQSDFSGCGSIGSECFFEQSTCGGRTVRDPFADGPRPLRGRSAGPTWTVRTGYCSSELVLWFLFVCFRFLSLGFLVVPLRLFEPCLGSCLYVWVRGVAIGV
jgi:hypothetical protein